MTRSHGKLFFIQQFPTYKNEECVPMSCEKVHIIMLHVLNSLDQLALPVQKPIPVLHGVRVRACCEKTARYLFACVALVHKALAGRKPIA